VEEEEAYGKGKKGSVGKRKSRKSEMRILLAQPQLRGKQTKLLLKIPVAERGGKGRKGHLRR
jgi:hypothetical protein